MSTLDDLDNALSGGKSLNFKDGSQIGDKVELPIISGEAQQEWQGTLATFTVTNTNDSGAGSLRQAITDLSDPSQPFVLQASELRYFRCVARVQVDPQYTAADVLAAAAALLQKAFGFGKRDLGQSVTAAELLALAGIGQRLFVQALHRPCGFGTDGDGGMVDQLLHQRQGAALVPQQGVPSQLHILKIQLARQIAIDGRVITADNARSRRLDQQQRDALPVEGAAAGARRDQKMGGVRGRHHHRLVA